MIKESQLKLTEIGSIPVNWETYKLSDVVEIIGGGTPKTSVKEYWNGDIPWLSVVDFNGELRWINDTEKKITQKGLEKSSTKLLKKGQIIISARGTVGEIGQLGRDMAFNQSCYGLTAKEMLTNDFLYSLLKYNITQLKTKTHGSVFETITRKTFEQIIVAIPPVSEQCEIAKILSDLDDKIALNTQINQTLESMAQAIFKSWFVDFEPVKAKIAAIEAGEDIGSVNRAAMRAISGKSNDELDKMQAEQPDEFAQLEGTAELFPAAMWDSELGEVPEGWEVGCVGDIVRELRKNIKYNDIDAKTPYLGLEHIPKKSIALYNWDLANSIKSNKLQFKKGNILFGKIRPYFHKVAVAPIDGICSTDIIIISPENDYYSFALEIVSSTKFVDYSSQTSQGTKMPRANWKALQQYPIIIPPIHISQYFNETVISFINLIQNNVFENRELSNLRDTLLPKLLSGEIRIPMIKK